ncbi:MAG: DMT family transporter [Eubacterium sp.]|nr:DMT family transporter [Eubacterium sp.]
MTNKNNRLNAFLLVIAALIWGIAFVAQSEGGDVTGPYTFTCIRYFIGAIVLLPIIKIGDKTNFYGGSKPKTEEEKKNLRIAGLCCGLCLTVATILQQVGLYYGTTAGKAGFLTACYIILVPIIGLFLNKKCPKRVWLAVAITLIGLYLLCINGAFKMQMSDVITLCGSLVWALHILTIDHFMIKKVDPVRLSSRQFFVTGIISAFPMFFIEMKGDFSNVLSAVAVALSGKALISILFAGVMSSGIAFTLQIIGQRGVNPTVASLIMSLESVFSVLAGWIILGEKLSLKEALGCVLIFGAIILSQLPSKIKEKPSLQV